MNKKDVQKQHTLSIDNLYAGFEGKEILHGVSLMIRSGQVYAVMGPNGSGKSTLVSVVMGHPNYQIHQKNGGSKSKIQLNKQNIQELKPEQRAKLGVFLAFQSPIAVPGVSVMSLLRSAEEVRVGQGKNFPKINNPVFAKNQIDWSEFTTRVLEAAKFLHLEESFLKRGINDGFSGGEKKKVELLQALLLRPKFALFDEIDTGLDVDALKVVAAGIKKLKDSGTGILIVTHYQRILRHIAPDVVHILVAGKLVKTGSLQLAYEIEKDGYSQYL